MKINKEEGFIHEGVTGPELTEKFHTKEKIEKTPVENPDISKKDDVIIEKTNN